tara:strand:+ start:613 stop:810 length:198 start_codon:yes stop_codon:yes gene_type:complete
MKVKIVFDVDAQTRRDINNYMGRGGNASHTEVASFIEMQTEALFEQIAQDDDVTQYAEGNDEQGS